MAGDDALRSPPREFSRIERPQGSVVVLVTRALEDALRARKLVLDPGSLRIDRPDGTSFGALGQDEYLAETGQRLPAGAYYDAAQCLGAVARFDLTLDWDEARQRLRHESSLWGEDLAWPLLARRAEAAWSTAPAPEVVAALAPRWSRLSALGPRVPPPEARWSVSPSTAQSGATSREVAAWSKASAWALERAARGHPFTCAALPHLGALVAGLAPPRPLRDRASVQSGALEHEFLPARAIARALEALDRWLAQQAPTWPAVQRAAELCTRLVSIHPFEDGNGRTARLVLDWELARAGLALPTFDSPLEAHCARFGRVEVEPPERFLERLTTAMERTHGLA
ncbi:MAG: Fic family protein [Myxococcaceae bacterium]|nr:Fic family protein [Myxococcaceae bacterium]